MAIKAIAADQSTGVQHVILGLNSEDVELLLNGETFTFPPGVLSGLIEESDIVLLFAETDGELEKRFPPMMRPV